MVYLKIIAYFLSILVPGYLIVLFFRQSGRQLLFKLSLAYGLGAFFISIQHFLIFFILKINFVFSVFYLILFIEVLIMFFLLKRKGLIKKQERKKLKKFSILEFVVLGLILGQFIFSFINSLSKPAILYDSLAMWSFKPKVLFYEKEIGFDNNNDFLYLGGGGHRNYPWHIPLMQFWLFENLGEHNDLASNLIFVFYFASILILLYYSLLKFLSRFNSLVFVFILSSVPLFFYHSFNAYADLTLSFYILAGFIFFIEWINEKQNKSLMLSLAMLSISFFIKDTAIIFVIAYWAILFLYVFLFEKQKIKSIPKIFFVFLVPILPWIVFKLSNDLGVSNVDKGIGFYPEVFKSFSLSFFVSSSWNIWWFIVIMSIIINFKRIFRNKDLFFGWGMAILYVIGTVILYVFTERYVFALDQTAFSRNILVILPVFVFITAISWKRVEKI